MIVSFFFILSYVLNVFKKRIFKNALSKLNFVKSDALLLLECLEFESAAVDDDGIKFMPPVFLQRYRAVYETLTQLKIIYDIKKVVDIGCSEISFFTHLKRLEGVEEYIGVDIDEEKLNRFLCRVIPLNTDYLTKRCSPLHVSIFKGSAVDPDERLRNANVIVAIELIEHMYPPELDDLPYNIFGVIQPEIAVFTTPNADFNVLFKMCKPNEFRHFDHKFEWSRSQFEDWANNLILRYPSYEVWFCGIGKGPDGTEAFGCCSQMAVFVRSEERKESNEFRVFYKSLYNIDYPYQTEDEKLTDILEYEVFRFIDHCSQNDLYLIDDKIKIPLVDLLNHIDASCTEEKLKEFLEKSGKDVDCINRKLTLVLPAYVEDNTSHSSFNDNCDGNNLHKDEEEIWTIEENDFKVEEEHWSCDIDNVNEEMKSNGNHPTSHPNGLCDDEGKDSKEISDQSQEKSSEHRKIEEHNSSSIGISEDNSEMNKSEELPKNDSFTVHILEEVHIQKINTETFSESSCSKSGAIPKANKTTVRDFNMPETFLRTDNNLIKEDKDNPLPVKDISLLEMQSSVKELLSDQEKEVYISTFKNNKTHENMLGPFQNKSLSDNNKKDPKCTSDYSVSDKITLEIEENIKPIVEFPSSDVETGCNNTKEKNVTQVTYDQSSSGAVPRSHSLENVNMYNCKSKNFRYSLNIDNKQLDCDRTIVDMELEICCRGSSFPSLTETCSHSKAVDSGYPNSTQDMELDLTPEQVDEIITETESSLEDEESSADERVEQIQGNPPIVFVDNVENGDVANNNRDGEGNNMEGGHVIAEELIFEDLVLGGDEVEAAGEHESEDEGLYLSALDESNGTIVPEDHSSAEDTVYLFDLPSTSSVDSIQGDEISLFNASMNGFPSWLLNMIVQDDQGNGDAGPDRDGDSSDLVIDREGQVDFFPGDARAGGEPD